MTVRPWVWPWGTRLKILVVIDGPVNTLGLSEAAVRDTYYGFGLGPVLSTLRDPSFAWWVRFEVDVARRSPRLEGRDEYLELADLANIRYHRFRFNRTGFDLNEYDQVWFFGYWPGEEVDDGTQASTFSTMTNDELRILAEWMDRGGGVLATGDHGELGASMCSRIPRVRTMRKWSFDVGAPSIGDPDRHETLQHYRDRPYTSDEGDRWPQPIEPVFRMVAGSVQVIHRRVPHPLLCSPDGIIDWFPDHMHEGEVIADSDVELDRAVDIPGYNGAEYPALPDLVLGAVGPVVESLPIRRPHPQVIAHGWTTNDDAPSERFGLLGVYDGDPVGIGRVVVDSTWHHWFSMNLVGFIADNPSAWRGMQAYYRNVALWLATPEQRASMLFAATWGALAESEPMAFRPGMPAWQVGERVVDVIGRTMPQCIVSELVQSVLATSAGDLSVVPADGLKGEPTWEGIPSEVVSRAIIGGIGSRMLALALAHRKQRWLGRHPSVDVDAIRRQGLKGSAEGIRMLHEAIGRGASDLTAVRRRLGRAPRKLRERAIPPSVELTPIRIVLERLQLPDPADPALTDGVLTITFRALRDGAVIGAETLESVEVTPFDVHGGLLDLDVQLVEAVVQSGERLTLELVIGKPGLAEARPELLRFRDTLERAPTEWLGRHQPDPAQPWRLWYVVELAPESDRRTTREEPR